MHHPEAGTAVKESNPNSPQCHFNIVPNMMIEIPLKNDNTSLFDEGSTIGSVDDESSKKQFLRVPSKKHSGTFLPKSPGNVLIAQRFFSSESNEGSSSLAQKLDFDNVPSSPRKRIPSTSSYGADSPQLSKFISLTKMPKRANESLYEVNELFQLKTFSPEPIFKPKIGEFDTNSCYSIPSENMSESTLYREGSNSFDSEPCEDQKIEYNLPYEDLVGETWIKTISPETLKDLYDGKFNRPYLVIDCRYGYEYQGGHISGAINLTTPDHIKRLFINNKHRLTKNSFLQAVKDNMNKALDDFQTGLENSLEEDQPLPILIFHCEFSQKRGPRALRFLRKIDRQQNTFPNLTFPEIYLLKGGYETFHSSFPGLCTQNGSYITMINPLYKKHFAIARSLEKEAWNFSNQLSMDFGSLSKSQGPVNNNPNNYYFQ